MQSLNERGAKSPVLVAESLRPNPRSVLFRTFEASMADATRDGIRNPELEFANPNDWPGERNKTNITVIYLTVQISSDRYLRQFVDQSTNRLHRARGRRKCLPGILRNGTVRWPQIDRVLSSPWSLNPDSHLVVECQCYRRSSPIKISPMRKFAAAMRRGSQEDQHPKSESPDAGVVERSGLHADLHCRKQDFGGKLQG